MQKYFKKVGESALGEGIFYLEFVDEEATRQVEVYNNRWFWFDATKNFHSELGPALADQPLSNIDLGPEDEISKEEFEGAWMKAQEIGE